MDTAGSVERLTAPDDAKRAVEALVERYASQADHYATDRQIDRLVYDLYGLTDEEIAIVEEAT
jgi:hypothetical protein